MKNLTAVILMMMLIVTGCRSGKETSVRRFELSGKVVSVKKDQHRITIAHKEIPGYMSAMTMPFAVKDEWVYRAVAPGQLIRATLVVDNNRSWLEDVVITGPPSEGAGVEPDVSPEPKPGTPVPDFGLTNQDGQRIHLEQYRRQVLLLTFIYTRCPLPDYCPLLTRNFSQIQTAVQAEPSSFPKLHLLSISFDSDYDTPEVLRSYGKAYRGNSGFTDWEFASGTPNEVRDITRFFGLTYSKESGQITHSMRTALIDSTGKLVQLYRGNDWRPAELLDELRRLKGEQPRIPRPISQKERTRNP